MRKGVRLGATFSGRDISRNKSLSVSAAVGVPGTDGPKCTTGACAGSDGWGFESGGSPWRRLWLFGKKMLPLVCSMGFQLL